MILVAAIPMALILVGCVWQIVGLSDALSFRESRQDAADSTAFHSAVLHARGMNAIASLNVTMGLLSAVTGLVRAIQVAGVLAGDPLASAADHTDAALGSRIAESLAAAVELQDGIATATPLMAAGSSAAASAAFYGSQPAHSRALAVSYSLLPAEADRALDTDATRPWLLTPARDRSGPSRLGSTSSLPISRAAPDALCSEARSWSAPEVQPLAIDVLRDPALAARARVQASEWNRALDEPLAQLLCGRSQPMAARCPADNATCQAQLEAYAAATKPQLPARVWPRAENGNVLLQTWASARGDGPHGQLGYERALGILANRAVSLTPERSAVAEAEYYFSCPAGRRVWPECEPHALWSLGWRARPRRLWRPDAAAPQHVARTFERSVPALERALRELGVVTDARTHLAALWSH